MKEIQHNLSLLLLYGIYFLEKTSEKRSNSARPYQWEKALRITGVI